MQQRPNIVFYFSDQQRWDTLGCYGQRLDVTPNLDALAAGGTRYENAFTCQPVCGPARACLQTGRYATEIGCEINGFALPFALTVGKKKYAEFDGLARETLEKARDLEHRFLDVMQRDTEAFNAVSAVFAMPKGTDEEKTARSQAMQQALQGCTRTPFEMMELSLEALRLTEASFR